MHWIGSKDKSLNMFQNINGFHLQKFSGFREKHLQHNFCRHIGFVADSATGKYG